MRTHHRHTLVQRRQIQERIQHDIRAMVAFQGFAIQHVLSDGIHPEFAYTIGLSPHELVISGLSASARVAWLLDLGFRLKGPPPSANLAQQHRYPPGGEHLVPGVLYSHLLGTKLPCCFGAVQSQFYPSHFGQAIVYHGRQGFPVVQFVWPDRFGRLPWEEGGVSETVQHILFNPMDYLPLHNNPSPGGF